MSLGTVISLCDQSSEMVLPWALAGYECICVDLQHPPGESGRWWCKCGVAHPGIRGPEWDTDYAPGDYRCDGTCDGKQAAAVTLVGADLMRWMPPLRRYAAAFAFPDCTNLSIAGAKHFRAKGLRAVIDGFELVERCREILEWTEAPYLLENPVGVLSSWWREPDYIFDPCDFARLADDPATESHTKKTCLWTGGGVHHA